MDTQKKLAAILPLYFVLFIDGMGLSLVIPILNNIIINPASSYLSVTTSTASRELIYGLVVGVFMLCWFFGATILGDLSDQIGRKRSLVICLVGSFLGYLISAFGILNYSLTLLIVGRVIAGLTAGSQPIAQAAIVDSSENENLARNIGFIILSISLGFVFGPVIGGVLSESAFLPWLNYATPMFFAAGLSILNTVFILLLFRETNKISGKLRINPSRAITLFVSAFKSKKIRFLSIIFFALLLGWSEYFTFISMFMMQRHHITPFGISMFLTVMGFGFAIGCSFIVGYVTKRYKNINIVLTASLLTTLGVALTVMSHGYVFPWILAFCIGASMSTAYSVILAIFSSQVGQEEQGWVMGVTGSIMALCFGVTSIGTGYIASYGVNIPLTLASIGLGVSGILMYIYKISTQRDSKSEHAIPSIE